MIAKVQQGSRTYGLLRYVYGPGRREEHQRPRLVASWDGVEFDPAAEHERRREEALYTLARRLDRTVEAYGGRLEHHVWHTSVRSAPEDPELSDAQWAQIARRLVAAGGIAPRDDPNGCRWIAVRHADDHVHLVATLVRQDGKLPDRHNDWLRLREECRTIERELGLRVTAEADRTAVQAPTLAEQAKAHRLRRQRATSREILREKVRPIALEATSEADFFARLRREPEMLVQQRTAAGQVVGYAVAHEGDTASTGEPIWFSGSKLAPDLSLPRVRQRWADTAAPTRARTASTPVARAASRGGQREDTGKATRIAAWQQATIAVRHAAVVLQRGDPDAAATIAALTDLMTVSAQRAPTAVRDKLELAARHMERVGRDPWQERTVAAHHVRTALQAVVRAGSMLGHDDEKTIVTAFVVATVLAVRAVYALRQAQRRQAHAQLARLAYGHLEYAADLLGARPRTRPDHVAAQRPDLHHTLRNAVQGRANAEQILHHPAWPSLAGMLARVERLGHNPAAALAAAVRQRPLRKDATSPARSETEVLIWRLQRWLVDHAPAATEHTVGNRQPERPRPSPTAPEPARQPAQPSAVRDSVERAQGRRDNEAAGGVLRISDDRLFQRTVLLVVQAQECSRALLERDLWVRRQKADELLNRLHQRGVIKPVPDSTDYTVTVPAHALPELKKFVETTSRQATRQVARQVSSTAPEPSIPRRSARGSSVEHPSPKSPRRR